MLQLSTSQTAELVGVVCAIVYVCDSVCVTVSVTPVCSMFTDS